MAYNYPIWVDVEACIYNSSKSYGAKNTNHQTIRVGSSSKNSHILSDIVNYKKEFNHEKYGDVISFRTRIDGVIVKELIFENKNGRAGKLLKERSALKRIKGL